MSEQLHNLLLHPRTRKIAQVLTSSAPHAILIAGADGSGKRTLGRAMASALLQIGNLDNYPYFFCVQRRANKQDIAIEQVREVISALKLKIPGKESTRRVIFIEDAHNLSIPGQNALLKILEEPNEDTVFLLSVDSVQLVLPTVSSRTQLLEVQSVTLANARAYFEDKFSQKAIEQAWRLSGGTAGLMCALLSKEEHPLKEAVEQTKKFLAAKKYERFLIIDSLSKDKEQFTLFLEALARTLNFLHHSALANNRSGQSLALLRSRKCLKQVQQALKDNANSKLAAMELVLNLKV